MRIKITTRCLQQGVLPSQCRACVDCCEKQAIAVDSNGLYFSTLSCDECGQCVSVCPVDAIEGGMPARRVENTTLFSHNYPQVTVKELLRYFAAGIREIVYSPQHQSWLACAQTCNSLLANMGESGFILREEQQTQDVEHVAKPLRALFDLVRNKIVQDVNPKAVEPKQDSTKHNQADDNSAKENKKIIISASSLASLYPTWQFFVPQLDNSRCTLCQACMRTCPSQVFKFDSHTFHIDNGACTGCHLCAELCPEKALVISAQPAKRQIQSHPVRSTICSYCHNEYQGLDKQTQQLCPSCQTRKRLNIPMYSIGQSCP